VAVVRYTLQGLTNRGLLATAGGGNGAVSGTCRHNCRNATWRWRWRWLLVTASPGNVRLRSGGSGVVVLRVPNTAAAVFSGGVATRSYDVVGYTTYEVQATTTTGETVTFYPNAFLAEYLVVAGGGGGGGSATNGDWILLVAVGAAGGYLASADAVAMAVVTGQAYPVIVGGGGAGGGTGSVIMYRSKCHWI
jgi:hypothetical protein